MRTPRPIPEEQAVYERPVIFDMINSLEQVKERGYSDWQTLTSFLANLLLDQDNPRKMLKQLTDDVRAQGKSHARHAPERDTRAPGHLTNPEPVRALPDQTVVRLSCFINCSLRRRRLSR